MERVRKSWACVLLNSKTFCVEDKTGRLWDVCYGLRGTYYCFRYKKEDAIIEAHEHFVDGYLSSEDYYEDDSFIIQREIEEYIPEDYSI